MAFFISYSHTDSAYVDKLAFNLIKNRANIWIDKWELNVGDSILNKIQDAISDADALLIILSTSSVQSTWCRKELTSGLIRELEEKRIIVLPILIEDCEIPLFLRDKLYADFRVDFDLAMSKLLASIANIANDKQGRFMQDEEYSDWAMDWGYEKALFNLTFTIVHPSKSVNMTFITEIKITCNDRATKRYSEYEIRGIGQFGRTFIAEAAVACANQDIRLLLEDSKPKHTQISIQDKTRGYVFSVYINSRRLGEDNGRNQIIDITAYFTQIREFMKKNTPAPTEREKSLLKEIIK